MKMFQRYLFCLVAPMAALALAGCGKATAVSVSAPVVADVSEDKDSFASTGFVLAENVALNVISADAGLEEGRLTLSAGTEIAILERKFDKAQGALVRVGIDANEEAGTPTDFWIRASELPDSALIPYSPADESGNDLSAEDDLNLLKKMTYCYRYVKQYLLKTGQVKVYLPGESAYMAAKILPKHGFRNTGHSPSSARDGEVCVYSGGPAGHGHIEIKRNGGWWYGYGIKPNPIQNRRFIACFAK